MSSTTPVSATAEAPRHGSPLGLATAWSGLLAAVVLGTWIDLIATPHRIETVEVHVRTLVLWWRQGLLPYVPADAWPIVQNPYGPIYLGLVAWLPDMGPYAAGRWVSLVAVLVCLLAIALWLRRRADRRRGDVLWLVVLLPLATKPLLLFAPLYRVDALGLVLTVLGFLVATDRRWRHGTAPLIVASGLFVAGFATKLTFLAAPAACALWWWLQGRRFRAVRLAIAFGLGAILWVVGMEWLTDGRYLASAAVGNLPTAPWKSFDMMARTVQWSFWWLALAALASRAPRAERPGVLPALVALMRRSPAACYLATSLATAAAFAANPLSSWNYLIEPCLALAILTGDLWRSADRDRRARAGRWLLAHLVVTTVLLTTWIADWRHDVERFATELAEVDPAIEALARSEPRGVVVDSLAAQDALAIAGAPPLLAAPDAVAALPEVRARLRAGLRAGELTWVVYGEHTTISPVLAQPILRSR